MSRPNTVHAGGDIDSASEDDLDLDELDPAATASLNGSLGHASEESKRRLQGKTGNIPLQRLQKYGGSRLWRSKGRQKGESAVDEDTEALLNNWPGHSRGKGHIRRWSEERAGWNVRNQRRQNSIGQNDASQARETPSRRPSQSMQFQEFVRQELADMRDNKHVDNADSREIQVGQSQKKRFPTNVVSNAKYTAWSFLPRTLYNEFSFFLNIYFLLVALSQIIPYLRIGYMSTYIVPLACVLTITIGKEAVDDIARRRRDAEANSELFTVVSFPDAARPRQQGVVEVQKRSRDIKVGDVLKLEKNQRVPADVVILQSHLTELHSELTTNEAGDGVA